MFGLQRIFRGKPEAQQPQSVGAERGPDAPHNVPCILSIIEDGSTRSTRHDPERDLSLPELMERVRQYNRLLAHFVNSFGGDTFQRWISDKEWQRIDRGLPGFERANSEDVTLLCDSIARDMRYFGEHHERKSSIWNGWVRETRSGKSYDATTLFLAEKVIALADGRKHWTKQHTLEVLKTAWCSDTMSFLERAFSAQDSHGERGMESLSIVSEFIQDRDDTVKVVSFIFPDNLVGARWHWSVVQSIGEWRNRNKAALSVREADELIVLRYQQKENTGTITWKDMRMGAKDAMKIFIRSQFIYMQVLVNDEAKCYRQSPFSTGWQKAPIREQLEMPKRKALE